MNDEQRIIELLFERDEAGLGLFEKKYKALCLKLALDITGDELTAEECLNDLYLRLWNSIPPERPASLKSFACRIIRNLALNASRHKAGKSGARSLRSFTTLPKHIFQQL